MKFSCYFFAFWMENTFCVSSWKFSEVKPVNVQVCFLSDDFHEGLREHSGGQLLAGY